MKPVLSCTWISFGLALRWVMVGGTCRLTGIGTGDKLVGEGVRIGAGVGLGLNRGRL
ncbi:hypothetical protein TIFTF001_004266 [Ficus carica]|uniref:Uncharacterized protein n=1 Tax=Ficus carica TaxID=3494 RepID=A0AA87ZI03_FICCA|nr:hypothetical protein TIFTF001_004266 [Ficus carica]